MPENPPTLRQLLHEFTADWVRLDEPIEFDFIDWGTGRGEVAGCVVTGLTGRQFEGRHVQALEYDWIEPRNPAEPAPWSVWANMWGAWFVYHAPTATFLPVAIDTAEAAHAGDPRLTGLRSLRRASDV